MKLLFVLFVTIVVWVCNLSGFAAQLDVNSDPIVPAEKDPFFNNSTDFQPHSPDAVEVKVEHHKYFNKRTLSAIIVASSVLGGLLLLLSFFSIYRLKKLKKRSKNSDTVNGISFGSRVSSKKCSVAAMDYQSLVAVTSNFDEGKVLGEGGLGRVYKAQFNSNFLAAVKKIHAGGKEIARDFENAVELLSKIQHHNIISLLGYCAHGDERFLIFEMMANHSLGYHLHGPSSRSELTWHVRMKIALDVARGLEYLHERCKPLVIHGNLKSSNILLDLTFNAKLSNFGLAFTGRNSYDNNVDLPGVLGHLAPEYLSDGKLTEKSDVYAFGVILLELLLGRRPMEKISENQFQPIVTWAMPQLTDRLKLPNIVDPAIKNTMDVKHLYQVAAIAVLCVQPEPSYRPLITDVLHSFIPLVPADLGGSLRLSNSAVSTNA